MIHRQELLDRAVSLPALPGTRTKLIELFGQGLVTEVAVVGAIESDPASAVNLLREANREEYGKAGEVGSVSVALSIVPVDRLKLVLIGEPTGRASGSGPIGYGIGAQEFVAHSVATAVLSRYLAEASGADDAVCFLAGLLHDIGKLGIGVLCPEAGAALRNRLEEETVSLVDAERQVLGEDHAMIGSWLTRHWRLPEYLSTVIELHHAPDFATGEVQRMADIVHLADALSHAFGYGSDIGDLGRKAEHSVSERLQVHARSLETIASEAVGEIARILERPAAEALG